MPRDEKRLKATLVSSQKRLEREENCVRLRKEKVRPTLGPDRATSDTVTHTGIAVALKALVHSLPLDAVQSRPPARFKD
jgi:hypothetical protein